MTSNDPETKQLAENYDFVIIPVVNVDGYQYSHSSVRKKDDEFSIIFFFLLLFSIISKKKNIFLYLFRLNTKNYLESYVAKK